MGNTMNPDFSQRGILAPTAAKLGRTVMMAAETSRTCFSKIPCYFLIVVHSLGSQPPATPLGGRGRPGPSSLVMSSALLSPCVGTTGIGLI